MVILLIKLQSQGNMFTIQVNTTQYGLRSFRYAGALLWNNLPLYVRDLPMQNSFKNELKKNYLQSYSTI